MNLADKYNYNIINMHKQQIPKYFIFDNKQHILDQWIDKACYLLTETDFWELELKDIEQSLNNHKVYDYFPLIYYTTDTISYKYELPESYTVDQLIKYCQNNKLYRIIKTEKLGTCMVTLKLYEEALSATELFTAGVELSLCFNSTIQNANNYSCIIL